jgi:glycosyltransferase involved in cell wall biosynthesis
MLAEQGAGWLFEPESVSSLNVCLCNILKNCPEVKTRGEVGSHYVRERYSWAVSAECLERIIISPLGVKA